MSLEGKKISGEIQLVKKGSDFAAFRFGKNLREFEETLSEYLYHKTQDFVSRKEMIFQE